MDTVWLVLDKGHFAYEARAFSSEEAANEYADAVRVESSRSYDRRPADLLVCKIDVEHEAPKLQFKLIRESWFNKATKLWVEHRTETVLQMPPPEDLPARVNIKNEDFSDVHLRVSGFDFGAVNELCSAQVAEINRKYQESAS